MPMALLISDRFYSPREVPSEPVSKISEIDFRLRIIRKSGAKSENDILIELKFEPSTLTFVNTTLLFLF